METNDFLMTQIIPTHTLLLFPKQQFQGAIGCAPSTQKFSTRTHNQITNICSSIGNYFLFSKLSSIYSSPLFSESQNTKQIYLYRDELFKIYNHLAPENHRITIHLKSNIGYYFSITSFTQIQIDKYQTDSSTSLLQSNRRPRPYFLQSIFAFRISANKDLGLIPEGPNSIHLLILNIEVMVCAAYPDIQSRALPFMNLHCMVLTNLFCSEEELVRTLCAVFQNSFCLISCANIARAAHVIAENAPFICFWNLSTNFSTLKYQLEEALQSLVIVGVAITGLAKSISQIYIISRITHPRGGSSRGTGGTVSETFARKCLL